MQNYKFLTYFIHNPYRVHTFFHTWFEITRFRVKKNHVYLLQTMYEKCIKLANIVDPISGITCDGKTRPVRGLWKYARVVFVSSAGLPILVPSGLMQMSHPIAPASQPATKLLKGNI